MLCSQTLTNIQIFMKFAPPRPLPPPPPPKFSADVPFFGHHTKGADQRKLRSVDILAFLYVYVYTNLH